MNMTKDLNYYLKLPYTIILEERDDGNGAYVAAIIKELPGCLSHGATVEEAAHNIQDAKRDWLVSNLEDNLLIPEPQKYTGQFHLRMSSSLHESLARMADMNNVSLNQYLTMALSRTVGVEEGRLSKSRKTKAVK
jgi:antitoxin HicB